jgi:TRAP-type C4-dicarboxylate transport system substrate-binding protein
MKFGKFGAVALAAILSAASLGSAQAETQLKALSAWATTLPLVPDVYYEFQENVTKASNGEITFQNVGPETVPPFEQLEPLSQGVFDVVFQSSTYHQAQTGMGVVLQNLIDLHPEKFHGSGMLEWLNDYYRKNFGVVVLSAYSTGPTTFVLTKPLDGDTRLDGRKIRTNASYEGIVRALGGSPVAMSPADAYAAMQKGTLDGVAWPASSTADFKLYEVAKYMTSPDFSQGCNIILMNAAKFDALPKELQDILVEAGRQTDIQGSQYGKEKTESQDAMMKQNGVQITEFSPEIAATIAKLDIAGALEVAHRSKPEDVDAALAVAKEKGLLLGQ